MNIPWLSDKTSIAKEGLCVDSEIKKYAENSEIMQIPIQFSK